MSDQSRRKLLKSIAAGSGAIVAGKSLPESWSKPVVDSVLLPAHAQTSGLVNSSGSAGNPTGGKLDSDSLFADVADALIPEAKAADPRIIDSQVCVSQKTETTGDFQAWVVYSTPCENRTVYYRANNVTKGVPTPVSLEFLCEDRADAGDVLNKLGLVNDAMAGSDSMVTIETFSGSLGGAEGQFEDYESPDKIPFNLGIGDCTKFNTQCEEKDCK